MDLNEFRCFVSESGVDVWAWIDMSISLACEDHGDELKERRDGIVQKLYASAAFSRCRACDGGGGGGDDGKLQRKKVMEIRRGNGGEREVGFDGDCKKKNEEVLRDDDDEEEEEESEDDDGDEQRKILEIKFLLVDDHKQKSESCLIELLQKLADMNTSFRDLKETDIGRHVTKLRKHSSGEVRRLVKTLVRKWKDTVDEWVRLNTPPEEVTHCHDYEAHQVNRGTEHASISYNLSSASKGKSKNISTSSAPKHHLEYDQETQHGEAKKPRNDNGIVRSANVLARN